MTEVSLLEAHWLVTPVGRRLHHATLADPDDLAAVEDGESAENVALTCGRRVGWVTLPGLFARMGLERCTVCCRKRGLPPGKGSPKNDRDCRRLLGLTLEP